MSRARQERAAPLSIRFTDTEKALLKERAGDQSLSAYIRETVLADGVQRRRSRQNPVQDGELLGHLLALLGQSHLSANLNQLAKAANQGSLPVSEETEGELRRACADVREMRRLLVRGLGLRIVEDALAPTFTAAAEGDAQ